ncbi:MAG: thiamine pyrophosphate-dependent dehydrogenase E1 component subunit alpha [Myxococcales bacterium]|nr:thiamine pyrophosphate-dependent dehydrogenase E1 component subunit alpha [Polyangiaceae bacterium]MDW8247692.1 thiamine pyrophosphate-dependent dehydrogenase E1 component subunit alpha [Myxococcales bacterium]
MPPLLLSDTGLFRVLDDNLQANPDAAPALPEALLLRMHREMLRLRLLETRMVVLQRQGRIGFYGSCTGQEAVAIAAGCALEKDDWVFPALRESAIMLVRGFPLTRYLAQVFGNSRDVLKGRQMPSHMSGKAVNQVTWSSCIGPQIPQAVGAAMAMRLRRDRKIAVGFCGDGATSQPDFHNALLFAGQFQPPCVLVCQNNHWSISVPTSRQTASTTLAIKARAYGIPGYRVDGNDALAVYAVLQYAFDRARRGEGPSFVECVTYRIGAHSTSDDPTRYRSQDEVEAWQRKDPLARLEGHLQKRGLLDEPNVETMKRELTAEIEAAILEVEQAPVPARATLFDDVYADLPWHLQEQREELLRLPAAASHGSGH